MNPKKLISNYIVSKDKMNIENMENVDEINNLIKQLQNKKKEINKKKPLTK